MCGCECSSLWLGLSLHIQDNAVPGSGDETVAEEAHQQQPLGPQVLTTPSQLPMSTGSGQGAWRLVLGAEDAISSGKLGADCRLMDVLGLLD